MPFCKTIQAMYHPCIAFYSDSGTWLLYSLPNTRGTEGRFLKEGMVPLPSEEAHSKANKFLIALYKSSIQSGNGKLL